MKHDKQVEVLKCQRCGWAWVPRKQPVRQCPKCKTLDFDKPKRA